MVKNKGFLPSGPSEVHIQRNQIKAIIFSLLPACTEPDPESEVPFNVDAIIANPPAYGNINLLANVDSRFIYLFPIPAFFVIRIWLEVSNQYVS